MSLSKKFGSLNKDLKVNTQYVADGERGNLATVEFMKKIAREKSNDPLVRQLAIKILNAAQTKSHNHADEAKAIGKWVQENISYMKDPDGVELLQNPVYLIEQAVKGEARGDCDDMALLVATLLISAGIKPYFKIVRWKNTSGNYNHIYVVVKEGNYQQPKNWISLDAIVKDQDMGYELPSASDRIIEI